MGMKKIEEKRQEYKAKAESLEGFVSASESLRVRLAKIQELGDNQVNVVTELFKKKAELKPLVEKLNVPSGSQQEMLKKNLLAICDNRASYDRVLPLPPKASMNGDQADIMQKLHERLTKLQELGQKQDKVIEALYAKKKKLSPAVEKIETHGIKEFEHYKKSLLAVCNNESFIDRPLPTKPLEKYVTQARKEADEMHKAWIDKQTIKMPKAIKKGMTFKDYKLNRIYEAVSGETKSKNPNLKGDAAVFVDCKWTDLKSGSTGGGYSVSRADLSAANHVKFLSA